MSLRPLVVALVQVSLIASPSKDVAIPVEAGDPGRPLRWFGDLSRPPRWAAPLSAPLPRGRLSTSRRSRLSRGFKAQVRKAVGRSCRSLDTGLLFHLVWPGRPEIAEIDPLSDHVVDVPLGGVHDPGGRAHEVVLRRRDPRIVAGAAELHSRSRRQRQPTEPADRVRFRRHGPDSRPALTMRARGRTSGRDSAPTGGATC